MRRAEYNLAQAVAMVNWATEQMWAHQRRCSQCLKASMTECPEDFCQRGMQLDDVRQKWRRRCKYAAKREGVTITVGSAR
jgi:hypothetical protein